MPIYRLSLDPAECSNIWNKFFKYVKDNDGCSGYELVTVLKQDEEYWHQIHANYDRFHSVLGNDFCRENPYDNVEIGKTLRLHIWKQLLRVKLRFNVQEIEQSIFEAT